MINIYLIKITLIYFNLQNKKITALDVSRFCNNITIKFFYLYMYKNIYNLKFLNLFIIKF